jgi:BirA family transcriptional regulator, biotin operon repressor / biotin---[acetyl-CoA-carboxylase] ligase
LNNFKPKTQFIAKKTLFVPSCHSTNDLGLEIIQNNKDFHGYVIMTEYQTAGRGQMGNSWDSATGKNLLCSIVLDIRFLKTNEIFYLNKTIAVSIGKCLRKLGANIFIKWPNDLLLNDFKIGGVLIENKIKGKKIYASVVGIGINVFQVKFDNKKASSLKKEMLEWSYKPLHVLEKLCEEIELNWTDLKNKNWAKIDAEYLDFIYGYREKKYFSKDEKTFEALIKGVSNDGKLLLEMDGLIKEFNLKEISMNY